MIKKRRVIKIETNFQKLEEEKKLQEPDKKIMQNRHQVTPCTTPRRTEYSHFRTIMNLPMTPEAAVQRAFVVAQFAREWFLARVLHIVPQQATARRALVATAVEATYKRLLARMRALVNAQVAAGGTAKATPHLLTGKRFLTCMRALVCAKVHGTIATVWTLVTRKRLLVRVYPLVSTQIGGLCKTQTASNASVWLLARVRSLVGGEV